MTLAGNHYRLNGFQIITLMAEKLTSDPTGLDGQQYFNTALGVERIKVAGTWRSLVMDNDSRLTDARIPTGSAAGAGSVLTGTYPSPSGLANNSVGVLTISPSGRGPGSANGGTANTFEPALRALGTAAGYAMPGNVTLNLINPPVADTSMNSFRIANVANPTQPQDAATKSYVDAALQGLSVKNAVRFGFTSQITLGNPGIAGSAEGDRVLIMGNSPATDNGIYVLTSGALVRAQDANTGAELQGAFAFISEGSLANTGWYQTSDNITLGTTSIAWTQFSSAGAYTAVAPIQLNGNQITIALSNDMDASSGTLAIRNGAIVTARLADGAVFAEKIADSQINIGYPPGAVGNKLIGTLPLAAGGTGSGTAAGARSNIGASGSYNFNNISNLTADTWYTIAHNLAANYVSVAIYDLGSQEKIDGDVKRLDGNNVQIRLGSSYAAGTLGIGIRG